MDVALVLLPSPLLGPAVWRPVADQLSGDGWVVTLPALTAVPSTPDDVLGEWLPQFPPDRAVVLVPHSNAGMYVPALAARVSWAGAVFVDAGLPPSSGTVRLSPEPFLEFLSGLADDAGLLPPWTEWWGDDSPWVVSLSAAAKEAVGSEAMRLPLSYFAESVRVQPGWDSRPCAYLGFGETYLAEQEEAKQRGWPLTRLEGEHLHSVADPLGVAAAIAELLTLLGFAPDALA
jgi:hypothetical protein